MKLSIFDYKSRLNLNKAMNYYMGIKSCYSLEHFVISFRPIFTYGRVRLEESKILYYTCKKPLSEMFKKGTPLENARCNSITASNDI